MKTNLLQPLTLHTAPEASLPILENIQKGLGFVPNLMATFANSPTVLQGYLALDAVYEKGTFTPTERQLILLTASLVNECGYCVAAHSTIAKTLIKVPAEIIADIRANRPVSDKRLDALVRYTRELVSQRGHVSQETVQGFLEAGYTAYQAMEVLLGVALKTISNYLYGFNPATLDEAFVAER
jgi:uncharacterized peroxidase-related enzyme